MLAFLWGGGCSSFKLLVEHVLLSSSPNILIVFEMSLLRYFGGGKEIKVKYALT